MTSANVESFAAGVGAARRISIASVNIDVADPALMPAPPLPSRITPPLLTYVVAELLEVWLCRAIDSASILSAALLATTAECSATAAADARPGCPRSPAPCPQQAEGKGCTWHSPFGSHVGGDFKVHFCSLLWYAHGAEIQPHLSIVRPKQHLGTA